MPIFATLGKYRPAHENFLLLEEIGKEGRESWQSGQQFGSGRMGKIIPVNVENKFAYNILISNDFNDLSSYLIKIKEKSDIKICIVTDDVVEKYYLDAVSKELSGTYSQVFSYVVEHGEERKNLDTVSKLYEFLIRHHFERRDLLVALGGGVVGDMTGFAAATYLRGIDFVQIPTTLLSQVDSSIGGKTGVDVLSYKNMVGAFYMPRLVYINTAVLSTLPSEQFACGMGEVIKYGLIQREDFFRYLVENVDDVKNLEDDAIENIIEISCRCKKEVVEIDPKERGIRAHLNFGHTIGHAIEKLSGFKLFHGQCVGLGMIAASYLSMRRGMLSKEEFQDVVKVVSAYDMPTSTDGMTVEEVLVATKSDKKMVGDAVKFILLKGIGRAFIDMTVTDDEMREAIAVVVRDA